MAEPEGRTGMADGLEPLSSGDRRELGTYRLMGRLGAGGMGIVYLARSATGRTAAVKALRPELLSETGARERFRREIAAVSRIPRRFTAPFLDADADENGAWMATAFIPGLSLQQSVSAYGPFPRASLYALWYGLLRALHSVHEAGVVHRDLKPSNVLLTAQGPRLIDFGISIVDGSTGLTSTGAIVGTPGYLAPEQVTGGFVGAAADVFALGAVMGFAATGHAPFDGDSFVNVLFNVLRGEPRLSSLPEDLDEWVRACLSKDPAHRPSVGALLAALPGHRAATAERLLADGEWLPEAVSAAALERTRLVLDLDHPLRQAPGPQPAVPRIPPTAETVVRPAPGGPTTRLRPVAQTSEGAEGRSAQDPATVSIRLPARTPPPPEQPPAVPPLPPRPPSPPEPPGGADPPSEVSLRTFSSPMEAELPPPPRAGLRSGWFRSLPRRRDRG
ncbi:serine/threonine-protein kinase [Streptomyces sp. NRRL WC-3742]|uniref:serine/threonine-protein kinase n=1 Tax=Streptomyces sp. NRRL WC-3742 TaxID=1463934 RepID=UPI0006899546|nr:serine/threonine-protein kinase [Streptomyces sp. NRRL WC-3742]